MSDSGKDLTEPATAAVRDRADPLWQTGSTRVVPRADQRAGRLDLESLGRALGSRYRLDRELEGGGMGQVFRATDLALERTVALKTIRPEILADPHWLHRFHLEATVSAGLRHPNIVQVHEVLEAVGRPVLVMEYVEGTDLQSALDAGSLREAEVIRILAAVCDALAFAHARGVIHRDVKPANILLDRDGVPKVADFGLATQQGHRLSAAINAQESGALLGSLAYMSPEQARGDPSTLDNRTDIYSLGATLYAALTGRPPIRGASATVMCAAEQRGDIPPPSRLRAGVSRDLEALCLKALATNPDSRYASATAMGRDLRNVLNNRPVSARSYGPWETLRRAATARRSALGGGAAAVILAFLGIAAAATGLHETAKDALFEEMRERVMGLASIAVLALDPRQVSAVITRADPDAPVVKALEGSLSRICGRAAELRYVWVMRRSAPGDSTLEFVAAGVPPRTGEAPVRSGEPFDARPYPDLLLGFEGPAADRDYSITDQWGVALSGYAPIKGPDGDTIAVLGVDMSQLDVAAHFEALDRALLITLLLSGALSLVALAMITVGVMLLWSRQISPSDG